MCFLYSFHSPLMQALYLYCILLHEEMLLRVRTCIWHHSGIRDLAPNVIQWTYYMPSIQQHFTHRINFSILYLPQQQWMDDRSDPCVHVLWLHNDLVSLVISIMYVCDGSTLTEAGIVASFVVYLFLYLFSSFSFNRYKCLFVWESRNETVSCTKFQCLCQTSK